LEKIKFAEKLYTFHTVRPIEFPNDLHRVRYPWWHFDACCQQIV